MAVTVSCYLGFENLPNLEEPEGVTSLGPSQRRAPQDMTAVRRAQSSTNRTRGSDVRVSPNRAPPRLAV
jgi:hypothetical protein